MVKAEFQRRTTVNLLIALLGLSLIGIFISDALFVQREQLSIYQSVDIKDLDIILKAVHEYNSPKGSFVDNVKDFMHGKYNNPIYAINRYDIESKLFLLILPFIFIVLSLIIYNVSFRTYLMVVTIYLVCSSLPLFLL